MIKSTVFSPLNLLHSSNHAEYIIQPGGNKSKIFLKGQIKCSGTGDHYPEDLDVPKASAWQSWKELGGWKCAAAGDKWILNTSLHGVTLSTHSSVSLCLLSLLLSSLVFIVPKETRRRQTTSGFHGNQSTIKWSKPAQKDGEKKGNKEEKEVGL